MALRTACPDRARLASALCLVAAVMPSMLAPGLAAVERTAATDLPAVELYIDGGPDAPPRLTPIDPRTLADPGDGPAITDCRSEYSCALSADSSTLVTLEYAFPTGAPTTGATVIVRDGLRGPERGRFVAPGDVAAPRLSHDGSRLVLERIATTEDGTVASPLWWDVYNTATGALLATATADGPGGQASLVDPAARRLYRFAVAADGATGPDPVEIVAHDLTTGAEVQRLELPGVPAGRWRTGRAVQGEPIMAEVAPGFAISPDGRQLAVVHADREAVTLIDSERLAVERAIRLSRPTSLGDRLLQLLPLAPRGAAAKEPAEGAWLQAAYGVDGDRVYVWGIESTVDDAGRWDYYGSGLSVVDLTVGTVAAEVLLRTEVHGVWPSPDGASIYVVGYDEPRSLDAGANVFPLFRLDAATLATLAKREFSAPRWLVLQPRASDDASMPEPGT